MVKVFLQSLILYFLIVQQHINGGLIKWVVSYRSCQVWISHIMASSICSLHHVHYLFRLSTWAKTCLIATPSQQLLPPIAPTFVLIWYNCKLKRKPYKLPLSLQPANPTQKAGCVTRFRSPGRLRHTKRKQNWKLHALIPIAILQCLRKVNLPVPKNNKFR